MQRHNQFIAVEYALVFYKGLPLVDWVIDYLDIDGAPYDLENDGLSFQLFEEREGRLWLELTETTGLSTSGNSLIFNTQDIDNIERGKYYYEISIYQNGYELLLSYGEAKLI